MFSVDYVCTLRPEAAPVPESISRAREAGAPALLVVLESQDEQRDLELGGSMLVRAGLTTWHSTPSPSHAFVVANGRGYRIDSRSRHAPEICPLEPIRQVVGVRTPALLVVASPWQLAAYDEHGLRWKSDRVAMDGLQIVSVEAGDILIDEDLGDESSRRRRLDVLTGKVRPEQVGS